MRPAPSRRTGLGRGCRSGRSVPVTATASSSICWRSTRVRATSASAMLAQDSHIRRYVDTIDFDHDEVFGVFNRRLDLIAMAHLAHRAGDTLRASRRGVGVRRFGVAQDAPPRLRPASVRPRPAARPQPRRGDDVHPRAEREHGDAQARPQRRRDRGARRLGDRVPGSSCRPTRWPRTSTRFWSTAPPRLDYA